MGITVNRTRTAEDEDVVSIPALETNERVDQEGMLRFVQRLFLGANNNAPTQVVFCGVGFVNGSSSVCASAGRALATYDSHSVCVVDANLRAKCVSKLLGVKPDSVRDADEDGCVRLSENLWFAGAEYLTATHGILPPLERLKQRLTMLRQRFDFVLIDAPGADISGDATILGRLQQGVVLVIDAEATRRIAARKVKESFDAAGVRLLGTVLHNRKFPIPKSLYDRL